MPKRYSQAEVYEMIKVYGSLLQASERLDKSSSEQEQPSRDKRAKFMLDVLIPQYERTVPEQLRTIDIKRLEERCREALI